MIFKDYGRKYEERSTRSQRLRLEERMLLRRWRLSPDFYDHQTSKTSSDLEDLHQNWKTFRII